MSEQVEALPAQAIASDSRTAISWRDYLELTKPRVVALMILKLIELGHVMSAVAVLYSYDIFGREQDWYLLRGDDVITDGDSVAVRLGSRARGGMVKTGANQGLLLASPFTADILSGLARAALAYLRHGRAWRKALEACLTWFGVWL